MLFTATIHMVSKDRFLFEQLGLVNASSANTTCNQRLWIFLCIGNVSAQGEAKQSQSCHHLGKLVEGEVPKASSAVNHVTCIKITMKPAQRPLDGCCGGGFRT